MMATHMQSPEPAVPAEIGAQILEARAFFREFMGSMRAVTSEGELTQMALQVLILNRLDMIVDRLNAMPVEPVEVSVRRDDL